MHPVTLDDVGVHALGRCMPGLQDLALDGLNVLLPHPAALLKLRSLHMYRKPPSVRGLALLLPLPGLLELRASDLMLDVSADTPQAAVAIAECLRCL